MMQLKEQIAAIYLLPKQGYVTPKTTKNCT